MLGLGFVLGTYRLHLQIRPTGGATKISLINIIFFCSSTCVVIFFMYVCTDKNKKTIFLCTIYLSFTLSYLGSLT